MEVDDCGTVKYIVVHRLDSVVNHAVTVNVVNIAILLIAKIVIKDLLCHHLPSHIS